MISFSSPLYSLVNGVSGEQVNAIESANMNLETMNAMREGAAVLKRIHGNLYVISF